MLTTAMWNHAPAKTMACVPITAQLFGLKTRRQSGHAGYEENEVKNTMSKKRVTPESLF